MIISHPPHPQDPHQLFIFAIFRSNQGKQPIKGINIVGFVLLFFALSKCVSDVCLAAFMLHNSASQGTKLHTVTQEPALL